jgi:invasion protein IalB
MRTESGDDPCQLYQLLKDKDGNNVAEISLFVLPPGNPAVAGATIVAPLETLLTEQLNISVDGANTKRYPFTWCAPIGCIARVGFTAAEVEAFKKGNAATLSIVPVAASDQRVTLDLSLKGFTAGIEAVSKSPAE